SQGLARSLRPPSWRRSPTRRPSRRDVSLQPGSDWSRDKTPQAARTDSARSPSRATACRQPTESFETRPTLCPTAGAKARFLLTEFHLNKIFLMPDHQPERPHDPEHSQLSKMELRVRALESVLTQKGYIEPAALDLLIETYEKKIGPHNRARVVAKAWVDEEFKQRLLTEPTPAIAL